MSTSPQILVTCLASYNAGVHHNEWMDADDGEDVINEKIAALLLRSKYPNTTIDCPEECEGEDQSCKVCKGSGSVRSAEEFGIFDTSGLSGMVGEWTSIAEVCEIVEALEKYGAAFAAACENWHSREDAINAMEAYCGVHNSASDYAEEYYEECCSEALEAMPNELRYSINWESVANGMNLTEIRHDGDLHIFTEW